jgi:hypothetical protein
MVLLRKVMRSGSGGEGVKSAESVGRATTSQIRTLVGRRMHAVLARRREMRRLGC